MAYCSNVLCVLILGNVLVSVTSAQSCNTPVNISVYHAQPDPFRGTVTQVEHPLSESQCFGPADSLLCGPKIILGDRDTDMEPAQPDLDNIDDLYDEVGDFMIWRNNSMQPYVIIQIPPSTITTIKLNILNYPAQNVSLPNIQLQTVNAIDQTSGVDVDFVLLDNEGLSQTDYERTSVTLRPLAPFTTQVFLLRWSFTGVYKLKWLFLSEVTICADPQPPYSADNEVIQFLSPTTNQVIQPSAQILASRVLELTCTVSTRGSFTWVWRQKGVTINQNTKFQIFTADGTRTSKLFISSLQFTDEASYTCEVSHQSSTSNQMTREFQVSFPVNLESKETVNGYLEEKTVLLTCEVHGYRTSPAAPTWFSPSGEELTNSAKYTIETGSGTKQVWFEDGTTGLSVVTNLTIQQLNETDEGNYVCRLEGSEATRAERSEETTVLVVIEGTAPPTTDPPTTDSGVSNSAGDGNAGAVAAGVIIGLLILALLIAIAVVLLILFLRKKDYVHFKAPRRPSVKAITRRLSESFKRVDLRTSENGTSNDVHSMDSQNRFTKADIEWQLPSSPTEKESELQIYSVVSKSGKEEKRDEDEPPPIPPQNFDPNDITQAAAEQNHYADLGEVVPGPKPQRRLTNSTSPTLAKLVGTKTGYGLEFNPIYASTSSMNKLDIGAEEEVDATNTYAEPSYPSQAGTASNSAKNVPEPVYSEALTPAMLTQSQEGTPDNDLAPFGPIYAEPLPLNKSEEPIKITARNIDEIRQIGIGQFGEVVLAETIGLSLKDLKLSTTENNKNIRVQVAVKKLRPDAQNPVREAFDKEIKFMSRLRDDNIVQLLAVCTGATPFIVMEYMENGDLHQFLSEHEPAKSESQLESNQLPASLLLYMAIQISSGLRYLASLKYVHRDLATRNCLVGKNFVVKIADFGMSRSLYESSYYRVRGRAMLPIRWMASESFYGRFSEKSDVWSFGVVMWEIFTFGKEQPYEELDDQEMIKDAIRTVGRRRLDRPEFCPMEVYEVMVRCWEYSKDARPTFEEIFHYLAAIQQQM